VLYFGTWGYGFAGLKGLLKSNKVKIVHVFTKWNDYSNDLFLNQVKDHSVFSNLLVTNTEKTICDNSKFSELILAHNNIDFIISCCYDRIFTDEIMNFPKLGSINIHPSLLPKYRGIKPLENAIINSDKETGVTFHYLSKAIDAGEIIFQKAGIKLSNNKTYKELYDEQCNLIENMVYDFFNDPFVFMKNAQTQNPENATWAPRLKFTFDQNDTVKVIKEKSKQKK